MLVSTLGSKGRPTVLSSRARALGVVLSREFDVPFRFYDVQGQEIGGEGSDESRLAPEAIGELVARDRATSVIGPVGGRYLLAMVVREGAEPRLVAAAHLGSVCSGPEQAREQQRLEKWLQAVAERIRLAEQLAAERLADEEQAAQLNRAWSLVLGLNDAIREVRTHRDAGRSLPGLLRAAQVHVGVQTVLWVPDHGGPAVVQGEALLAPGDGPHLAGLIARAQPGSRPGDPVLWNEAQAVLWSARFPGIVNLLAAPVSAHGAAAGYLIALNKLDAPGRPLPDARGKPILVSFRRSDAAALLPFASLLELQVRGAARFAELKELLVGLTRSLTAAIDAKDSYTFGHSERVARVAVELGRELGLTEDELSDIYLAGLLHDIGKIGVRDSVLTKRGPLTAEEYEHVKQHVTVGYHILSELRPLHNLLPGVLSHHERYDGGGYPQGLAGEKIPLVARILAVADGYDAMSARRPYRDALSTAEVEETLRRGAGTQWDERVVAAFWRCRQRIHLIRQRGVGESLTQALEGALRTGDSSLNVPSLQPGRAVGQAEAADAGGW